MVRLQADTEEKPSIAFTIDVEEWFQVGAYERTIARQDWLKLESRVEAQMDALFELLAQYNARATFFMLGWVAKRHPALVQRAVAAGHEIASHGMDHRRLVEFSTPQAFFEDAVTAKQILEDAGGEAIAGYRAPNFSLSAATPWVYDMLAKAGFLYSSSIYPVRRDHYGDPGAPCAVHRTESGIIEAPMSVAHIMGRRWPASGGGFFRLLPYGVSSMLLVRAGASFCPLFYMHPWEIDPGQPKVTGASLKSRFRHRLGLAGMENKLRRLLSEFSAHSMKEAVIMPFMEGQAQCA